MKIRIGLGASGLPFSTVAAFWRWVEACEDSIVDSLWISDRPVSAQPTLEPVSTLAALAGHTRRLKFGSNALVLPLRDPLVLAKECATIDYLSNGRLLLVVGVGRDEAPEWRATGRDPGGRGRRSDEMLQIMNRLWREDDVDFDGKYYQYQGVSIAPKPVQTPLPLWIGGSSPAAIRRTVRYGSGWLGGVQSPRQVRPVIAAIKAGSAETGRPIDDDHYGAGFQFRFGDWDEPVVQRAAEGLSRLQRGLEPREIVAAGGAKEIIGRVQEYIDTGVSKFVLRPIAASDAEVMDQTRRLIDEVLPVVHAPGFATLTPSV